MKYRTAVKMLCAWSVLAALSWSAAGAVPPARATVADLQLQDRVEEALISDPYFYAAHVTVSVEKGNVVLRGFVFSDWDLRDAIRIATKAAGGKRVIDDLTIEVGGRR
jgi:osmotically-inducible protein OsmY